MPAVTWKDQPDDHDFPAAISYLLLILTTPQAMKVVDDLHGAEIVTQKAKDILRASGLGLLPPDDIHVAADLVKVKKGEPLSPILLVRGQFGAGIPLQIADGYHRVCASYHEDENTDIPCRIVDFA